MSSQWTAFWKGRESLCTLELSKGVVHMTFTWVHLPCTTKPKHRIIVPHLHQMSQLFCGYNEPNTDFVGLGRKCWGWGVFVSRQGMSKGSVCFREGLAKGPVVSKGNLYVWILQERYMMFICDELGEGGVTVTAHWDSVSHIHTETDGAFWIHFAGSCREVT